MKKPKFIIGIDPDVDRSGVATLNTETHKLELVSLTFPLLLDYLMSAKQIYHEAQESFVVVVEAGWVYKANWHLNRSDNTRTASAKGNATGRNHETGRKIVEMCTHYDISVSLQPPLRKMWQGADGKVSHNELTQFANIPKRTNQEERDAVLLAWNYANLPIKIGKL